MYKSEPIYCDKDFSIYHYYKWITSPNLKERVAKQIYIKKWSNNTLSISNFILQEENKLKVGGLKKIISCKWYPKENRGILPDRTDF